MFEKNFVLMFLVYVCYGKVLRETNSDMSKRTALNQQYKGLVEAMSIPVELHERDGRRYASHGSVVPVHCCSQEQVSEYAQKTHHYSDVFSEQVLAPLGELAYVRLDENTTEKVFINRTKRLLVWSSDGRLALWRCAPSFESANQYMAGTPIVNKEGALISVVTARRGNHYAVSTFEGEGGYFDTTEPWKVLQAPQGSNIYGDKQFSTREEVRAYIAQLPPAELGPRAPPVPVIHQGPSPRIALVASNGRQIAHHYLHGVIATGIEYL